MAYNSTEWRDRIAYFSGSQSGTRSWGALGQSQFQGKYHWALGYSPFSGDVLALYKGCAANENSRTVGDVYLQISKANYTQFFCGGSFLNSNYSGVFTQAFFIGGGIYSTYAGNVTPYFSAGYCSFYAVESVIGVSAVTPSAFYSYTPWGGAPYFAGSNIEIPANNTDATPYQRQYKDVSQC